jgi:hypothetical protein
MTVQLEYRKTLSFKREEIEGVLPGFFPEDYPLLIKLFEYYFDYVKQNDVTGRIDGLLNSRDITAVSEDLLSFLQQELLLGADTFGGISQRDALKISSYLYNTKGSKYSIQQFFRYFYGFDPEIVYTKNNVFIVGESEIGPESRRFITNDRLYQTFAVLIRTPISLSQWEKAYKLFVHPAGLYLGAEVIAEDTAHVNFTAPEAEDVVVTGPVISDTATITITAQEELTALINN